MLIEVSSNIRQALSKVAKEESIHQTGGVPKTGFSSAPRATRHTRIMSYTSLLGAMLFTVFLLLSQPANAEGVDWAVQDKEGKTLLHRIYEGTAWQDKSAEEKLNLLNAAFINKSINPNLRDKFGNTAAHYGIFLMYQKKGYDFQNEQFEYQHPIALLDLLVSQKNFDPNIRDYYYRSSPLMLLIEADYIFKKNHFKRTQDIFSVFLKRDGLTLNWQNNIARTLLDRIDSEFFSEENAQAMKAVLESKSIELVNPYHSGEGYGLWKTIQELGFETTLDDFDMYRDYVLERLTNSADPNYTENHFTALTLLADTRFRYYGADVHSNNALRAKLAAILIEYGANVNDNTPEGFTPLHLSLGKDNTDLVRQLLAKPELDLTRQDWEGNTAAMNFFRHSWSRDTFSQHANLLYQRKADIDWSQKNYQGENLHDILHNIVNDYNSDDLKPWIKESQRIKALKQTNHIAG